MLSHNELVQIVRAATDEVCVTMLAVNPEQRDAYQDTTAALSSNGVVSLIGLAGAWIGTGSISCSANLACKVAGCLMMTEYDSVTDEVLDAVAEVTNMIIGNVKTSLEEHLGPMGLSIPTVIHGRNFASRTVGTQEWSIVPFTIAGEILEVQLCLAQNREAGRPRLSVAGQEALQI